MTPNHLGDASHDELVRSLDREPVLRNCRIELQLRMDGYERLKIRNPVGDVIGSQRRPSIRMPGVREVVTSNMSVDDAVAVMGMTVGGDTVVDVNMRVHKRGGERSPLERNW